MYVCYLKVVNKNLHTIKKGKTYQRKPLVDRRAGQDKKGSAQSGKIQLENLRPSQGVKD